MDKRQKKYKPIYDEWIKLYPRTLEDLPNEIFKPVPNYEDYHCSNFGRVKSFNTRNGEVIILKPLLGDGYLFVNLYKGNKLKHFSIHRLVGELFISNPDNKPEVNHLRGRFNNYVECLEWATSSENNQHAHDTGLAKAYNAKLVPAQILEIRENPLGLTLEKLAEKFGIARQIISLIQRGKSYKNVGGQIRESKCRRLPENVREEIRQKYSQGGISRAALAKEYGVNPITIWRILKEK